MIRPSLSRQSILDARTPALEIVEVPEWGGAVFVRSLSLGAMLALSPKLQRDGDVSVDLVIACVCDEAGDLVFTEEDADQLRELHYGAMQRVALAALKLNRLRGEDTEALAKN